MNQTAVVEYNVTDAVLAKMEADYMGLTVKGLDDKDGFDAVHKARMIVKNTRVDVEKKRKELKASALEWGKKVDSEAKRIFAKIEPIETHLTTEEEKITKEKERILAEKAKAEEARVFSIRERIDFIRSAPNHITLSTTADRIREILKDLIDYGTPEEVYQEFIETAKSVYAETVIKIEQALSARVKFEAEEAERKAESERLAKERAELDRIRAEEDAKRKAEEARLRKEREVIEAQQRAEREKIDVERRAEEARMKAERDKLEAERRKIEDARREQEHREAVAKAEKEAAERAVKEAKERAEREAKEKAAADERAKAEADRQEALKPDKEKLQTWAASLLSVSVNEPNSLEAKAIVVEARKRILAVNRYIIKAAQEL